MLPYAIGAIVLLFVVNPLVYKTLVERYTEQKISFGKSLLSILTVMILSGIVSGFVSTPFGPEGFVFGVITQFIVSYLLFAKVELKKYNLSTHQLLIIVGSIVSIVVIASVMMFSIPTL